MASLLLRANSCQGGAGFQAAANLFWQVFLCGFALGAPCVLQQGLPCECQTAKAQGAFLWIGLKNKKGKDFGP